MPNSAQDIFTAGLVRVPPAWRAQAESHWQYFQEHLGQMPADASEKWLASAATVWASSDFVAQTCRQHPQVLQELVASGDLFRPYAAGELSALIHRQLIEAPDEAKLKTALRAARRREWLRIAWRDLADWADLNEVMAALSEFADAAIDAALTRLFAWAQEKHGVPMDESTQQAVTPVVLALGKLGGRELNFSSDVDLMFVYTQEGEVQGPRPSSNQEFFIRLGQSLIQVLSEMTAEGFVFRVDMRLRPNGASGPLAISFDAMEHYYQTHGREWERYALIKARVAAGDRHAGEKLLATLKPFIFRKYLDYGAIESIRALKAMIERELNRKGMQANIKLGPGGIREIEFIGQALQLIRGGREPPLQDRAILTILTRLAAAGHLAASAREELTAAYVFLRNTEHRLQMVADRQVHALPPDAIERERLAFAMGFPDWPQYESALGRHRHLVHVQFSAMFAMSSDAATLEEGAGLAGVWLDTVEVEVAHELLRHAGFSRPQEAAALLTGLREGSDYNLFSSEGRTRMDRLMPLLLAAAGRSPEPMTTLARLVHLLEAIGRRSAYFALLIENPPALTQLVQLCSASPWIANWIAQHPIILDELLDPRGLYAPLARKSLEDEMHRRLMHVPEDDLEMQLEALREFRHGHVLRVAAAAMASGSASGAAGVTDSAPDDSRDGGGRAASGTAAEEVGKHLACIADVVIAGSLELASKALIGKHGRPVGPDAAEPGFAVIGYGKLGSLELGYASDLDMIFLYESGPGEAMTDGARRLPNEQFFARLGQRLIHYLTARTPAGILYEVDMRLRPSGQSGPLVTSLAAFHEYQKTRAWTWEHQALIRARPVAGKPELCREFSAIRQEILCSPRDGDGLKRDVREMRAKMAAAHRAIGAAEFDIKHSRGGIVDIEFMVQYWVLRWAPEYPGLSRHTDNIHILAALEAEGRLASEQARWLSGAYRRYLSMEHRLKLMERGSMVDRAELGDWPENVQRIWKEVFD